MIELLKITKISRIYLHTRNRDINELELERRPKASDHSGEWTPVNHLYGHNHQC